MTKLTDIMTPNPLTLGKLNNIHRARQLMAEHHFRHLPIIDTENGAIAGVLTQKSLLKNAIRIINSRGMAELEHVERSMPIESIMDTEVSICALDASVKEAALRLKEKKGGCVLITENEKLVGILTSSDFVDYAIATLD